MDLQLVESALKMAAVVLAEGCQPDNPDRMEAFNAVMKAIKAVEREIEK